MKKFFFIALFFISFQFLGMGQLPNSNCNLCPYTLDELQSGTIDFLVSGASDSLSPEHGVCAFQLNLRHNYIGDLSISLTSPSGQTVDLVRPIGLYGETDSSIWNISFLRCGDTVTPDIGKSPTYTNEDAWGKNNTFTGSYHPYNGCLEDFDYGPKNGLWQLHWVDGQLLDTGILVDFALQFCDSSDIITVACEGEGGVLEPDSLTYCVAAMPMVPDIQVLFTGGDVPASNDYDYVFFVVKEDTIVDILHELDSLNEEIGQYKICGFSYPKIKNDSLPEVGAAFSSFVVSAGEQMGCSDFLTNCTKVNITATQMDMVTDTSVCEGLCVDWYGEIYCASGSYVVSDTTNGCAFSRILHLTIENPATVNLSVQDTIYDNADPLVLDTLQDGIIGHWSGDGVTDDVFNPMGLNGDVELVFVQDTVYCAAVSSTSIFVQVTVPTTSTPDNLSQDIQILQDNSNSTLQITSDVPTPESYRFSLIDVTGRALIVQEQMIFPGSYTLDISHLPQGMYWLSFASAKGGLTKKLIKH
ncbi:MAG TPA: T9SS type A sorting domain-containing protein [Saprospiraceae bacterium]|nr:T9SS type A sorting domain-containing protein [Saprospiraceae bacterium]